jgi:thiosulfate/3-mercaptopyruvate sulfurtransferase
MDTKTLYSPAEVHERLRTGDITLIDVRAAAEFEAGHIPGAANVPQMFSTLSMTTEEGLREMVDVFAPLLRAAGVEHGRTVVVYEDCLHTRCGSSCRGYFQLELFGHEDLGILDGGLAGWRGAGFPVTTEPSDLAPSTFQPRLRREFLATLDDMVAVLDDPNVKLLDNRDEEEWRGMSSSPYGVHFAPRKGRIPGARWVEWYEFMTTDLEIPTFKSAEAVRSICAQVGLDLEDDIVVYCFKGARASNTYVAMRAAGFKHLRNYYGSWNEWSRHLELPIDETVLAASPPLSRALVGCSA